MTKQMIIAAAFAACSAFAQDAPPPPAPDAPSDAPEMQPPLKEGEAPATAPEAGTARAQVRNEPTSK
ncbi:hypothetical protein [Akkermansia sp. BCRC 18949]|uniref:hypothetical protein n=1 Tax=Akkermansia sp. BCRC 18949 TaxID=3037987 RepID=UPI00384ADB6A